MKNTLFAFLIVMTSLALQLPRAFAADAAPALADDTGTSAWDKKNFFSVMAEYWHYEEFPDIMTDSGPLLGLQYDFRNTAGMFFYEAGAEITGGRTTYDGHTLATNSPVTFTQTNYMYIGQVWGGVQIHAGGNVYLIPKVGFHFRNLTDLDDSVSGDYRRDERYYTLPIGMDVIVKLPTGRLAFTAWATADFHGQNTSHFTNIGGDHDGHFKQTQGFGAYMEGNYLYDKYIFGAYLRYWKVKDSNFNFIDFPADATNSGDYFEPKNETIAFGVKAGFAL